MPEDLNPIVTLTEADLLRMLKDRYCKPGNGGSGEYAMLFHVRDAAGFDAKTTIDALALGLWPSRGHLLHGFEVKTSRADWLRELKNPAKAERIVSRCDRFWLVTASRDIIQPGELPATWGHLTVRGNRLVVDVEAPSLRDEQAPIDHGWLACLLRAAGAVGTRGEGDSEVEQARAEGRKAGLAEAGDKVKAAEEERDYAREKVAEAGHARARFFRDAGLPAVAEWRAGKELARIAPIVCALLAGEDVARDTETTLRWLRDRLDYQRQEVDRVLGQLPAKTTGTNREGGPL